MERSVITDRKRIFNIVSGLIESEIDLLDTSSSLFLSNQLAYITALHTISEIISSSRNTEYTLVNSTKDVTVVICTGTQVSKKITLELTTNPKKCYRIN